MPFSRDVVVVGGCGHVGLPLALAFAGEGLSVASYDIDTLAVAMVDAGQVPFTEPGAPEVLRTVLGRNFLVTGNLEVISSAEHVIVAAGIPDEHLDSRIAVLGIAAGLREHLRDGQLLVLRSTISPGITEEVAKLVADTGKDVAVAYCPERIMEGHALEELRKLPQIVSGTTPEAAGRAAALFHRLTSQIVTMLPEEAELAKLFTNAWRYITFGVANQLWMAANDLGADYERIRQGLAEEYPRAAGLLAAGFAGGPCLPKDTALLRKACPSLSVAQDAIFANQDLPRYVTLRLAHRYRLADMTVGILGMAFKAGSDDSRGSMTHQLRWLLEGKAREVLCTDPHVRDESLVPLGEVLSRADLLVIATPHEEYRNLDPRQPVADIWNVLGRGVLI